MPKLVNKDIPIAHIRMSKQHWEREITEEDVEDLAENIALVGQIHQIAVRPIGKAGTKYELISGERRIRALRANGEKVARCVVVQCDDWTAELLSLSENLKAKPPSSSEWRQGMKRLKDMLADKYRKEEEKQSQREADLQKAEKRRKATKKELPEVAPKKSRGRPKDPDTQATRDAAKIAGVSESKARRAIKQEEDLIPTAIRALDRGTITADQANRLANMPVSEQRQQLRVMIQETQQATKERLARQRAASQGDTAVAERMLIQIVGASAELNEKVEELLVYLDGKEIDYDTLATRTPELQEGGATLFKLAKFLEED